MPEENKKENLTFSDKMKDSKTAASKSFANRVSSRIGRDGKPKQTIFERTKRDAPFFIAALVALLLLPFLYKYSGSVREESVVTPSSSTTAFDPERYAFSPDVENPEGEIAHLSARNPLDLIIGLGDNEEKFESSDEDYLGLDAESSLAAQKDAYAESASARRSALDTNVDIEENTTNIYKKRAVAGTRHGFKRAATKIEGIKPGGKPNTSGGSRFNVNPWGGSLKNAAQKVRGNTPKNSPKPVSLQPLQAAGKPARVNFGDAANAMRQAKDALGKRDAERAILDAQVKPVEPGSFGGMTFGDTKFGGGGGKVDRKFSYQPQTPWWWDEMKSRSHYAWQKKFDWKWGIYDWMTKLAENFLGRLLGCLLTGDEDWKMEHFLGTAAGSGDPAKCNGAEKDDFLKAHPGYSFSKKGCKQWCKDQLRGSDVDCGSKWEEATTAARNLNFFQTRAACLGAGFGYSAKSQAPDLKLDGSCVDMNTTHHYKLRATGRAEDWDSYIYVVVRNYVPVALTGGQTNNLKLCSVYGNNLRMDKESSAGVDMMLNMPAEKLAAVLGVRDQGVIQRMIATDAIIAQAEKKAEKGSNKDVRKLKEERLKLARKHAAKRYVSNNVGWTASEDIHPESLDDACVIFIGHGRRGGVSLDWEEGFKQQTTDLLEKLIKEQGLAVAGRTSYEVAVEAFSQLDLMFVEGMASEKTLSHKSHIIENLPMPYWQFREAYLERYGTTGKENDTGSRASVTDRKSRHLGHDTIVSERCYFDNSVKLECVDNAYPPTAYVIIDKSYHGGNADSIKAEDLTVTAEYVPIDGLKGLRENPQKATPVGAVDGKLKYIYTEALAVGDADSTDAASKKAAEYKQAWIQQHPGKEKEYPGYPGKITWKLSRTGNSEVIRTVVCDNNNAANEVVELEIPQTGTNVPQTRPETNLVEDRKVELHFKDCTDIAYNAILLGTLKGEALKYMQTAYPQGIPQNTTVGDVAEAIYKVKGKVPANLVCVMVKTIGNASRDPHAPQTEKCPFDNIFGSVFAFMGLDAASFPSQWTNHICKEYEKLENARFPSSTKFWWGGYVDDRQPGKEGIGVRVHEFIMNGQKYWTVNGKYPLAGLLRGTFPTDANGDLVKPKSYEGQGSLENYYRNKFHTAYADLEDANIECHYSESDFLDAEDVLAYLTRICEIGLDKKPEGRFSRDEWQKIQRERWAKYCKEHPGKCNKKRSSTHKGSKKVTRKPGTVCHIYGNNKVDCD